MEFSRGKIAAALVTWIAFLVIGTEADPVAYSGQKCYACGPLAAKWYQGSAPSCNEFDKSEKFAVECGQGYGSCASALGYELNELSRMCVKAAPNGCRSQANSKTKTIYNVCSCNGQLCNENLPPPLAQNQSASTMSSVSTAANSNEQDPTTASVDQTTVSTTIKLQEKADEPAQESDSNQTIQLNESKEVEAPTVPASTTSTSTEPPTEPSTSSSTSTTPVPTTSSTTTSTMPPTMPPTTTASIPTTSEATSTEPIPPKLVETNEIKKETMEKETHALPEPAALGQENEKKTPQKQGAPVDDEEDSTEGSGSRIDTDHKNQTPPTTTVKSTTAEQQSDKNSASLASQSVIGCTLMLLIVKILN